MRATRSPSVLMLVLALFCATSALIFVAAGISVLGVVAIACGAALMAAEVVRTSVSEKQTSPVAFARLVKQAQAGRRLAIYDRDTGLFAHWYMALRGQEECARSTRYGRTLGLLVVEPGAGNAATEWQTKSDLERWFQNELRATDLAGYVGNGRYVVLAPEAGPHAIARLIERLREKIDRVDIGTSALPDDGATFDQLWRRATSRLQDEGRRAA